MVAGTSRRAHIAVRPDWLATQREDIFDPEQPIIDAHHHLFDRPDWRYLFDDLLADLQSGHDIRATVYVQGRAMLRAEGPESMKPVGETEFANGIAAMSATGAYGKTRACAGIVSFANLLLGDAVQPVLEAHLVASGGGVPGNGRLRGIRHIALWDADPAMVNPAYQPTEDMLASDAFRAGFSCLAPRDLSFDAWLLFHQLPRLEQLARAFPDTRIVLDHCGGIAGIGPYAGKRDEVFALWSNGIEQLARCSNVMVKLGGLGTSLGGFGFETKPTAPASTDLAQAWRPYFETVIEAFGAKRCMFESNFPVDKGSYSYAVGWNAMKRIASSYSPDEKDDLFWRSARQFYQLQSVVEPRGGA